ncbi:hypothetical protein L218DRAFT_1001558 [Marasmius fiardii PR-910]|nr:hypothetical protein L218DRAFT_1001558 [Marasmius fiardii PR-910]
MPNDWAKFWTTNSTAGMAGLMRVDGELYVWLGAVEYASAINTETLSGKSLQIVQPVNVEITPTSTVLSLNTGKMRVNVTFLNPIEPNDLVLQSFPFSYIIYEAESTDGLEHSFQIYQDVTGEWLSEADRKIQWDTQQDGQILVHSSQLQSGQTFNVRIGVSNCADDGVLYFATTSTGTDSVVRLQFLNKGSLANTKDTEITRFFPVFGISHDFGNITSTALSPAVVAVGLARDPGTFEDAVNGRQTRPYFFSKYNSVNETIKDFLSDFPNARSRAKELDRKILEAAGSVSSNYAELVSLCARQTFGGVETVNVNRTPMMFMKDVGNSHPVETIYASFPAFLYVNSSWGKNLLEPILSLQVSLNSSSSYAVSDLGGIYPNAGVIPSISSRRAIEGSTRLKLYIGHDTYTMSTDSGSMLIMAWAHAKYSGDRSLMSQYYDTLKRWTEYLIPSTLDPDEKTAADGQKPAHGTNLAIKGIIGIRAMADISNALGETGDAKRYLDISLSYATKWQSLATSPSGYLTSTYGRDETGGMMYNLYADKLLATNLVPKTVYDVQTSYYIDQLQTRNSGLMALDSLFPDTAKTHWTLFTAATTSISSLREYFIKSVHDKATDPQNLHTFATTWSTSSGGVVSGNGSPAQGAMFAILALNLESKISGMVEGASSPSGTKVNAGVITGSVVGVVVLCLLFAGVFLWLRRRRRGARKPQRVRSMHEMIMPFIEEDKSVSELETPPDSQFALGSSGIQPLRPYSPRKEAPTVANTSPSASNHVRPSQVDIYRKVRGGASPFSPERMVSRTLSPQSSSRIHLASDETLNIVTSSSRADVYRENRDRRPAALAPVRPESSTRRSHRRMQSSGLGQSSSHSNVQVSPAGEDTMISVEAHQLRADVENLRRALQDMRALTTVEPPPYSSDTTSLFTTRR